MATLTTLTKHGQSRFYVVGTSFGDRASTIRKNCFESMNVILHREPNNQHDPNAISVWVSVSGLLFGTKQKQIGYLKKSHAAKLAKVLDAGIDYSAVIDDLYIPEPGLDVSPNVKLEVNYQGRDKSITRAL